MDFVAAIKQKYKEFSDADSSQYFLSIADLPQDQFFVLAFEVDQWRFDQDYRVTISVLSQEPLDVGSLLYKTATIRIFSNGALRPIHGLVVSCDLSKASTEGMTEYKIVLNSVLSRVAMQRRNRVFTDKTAVQIAKEILKQDLDGVAQLDVQCGDTEVLPICVQFQEDDLTFIKRILAKEGVFLNLAQSSSLTKVQLCDRITQTAQSDSALSLPYIANTGAAKDQEHIYQFAHQSSATATQVVLNEFQPWKKQSLEVSESVEAHNSDVQIQQDLWALNYHSADKGKQIAKRLLVAQECRNNRFLFETNCRTLSPGVLVDFIESGGSGGQYRVLDVSISGAQTNLIANGADSDSKGFMCRFIAIPTALEYAPEYLPKAPVYLTLSAITTSELDDKGCYRIRFAFDRRMDSDGASSPPVRLMQTLGGTEQGMHFPLAVGTHVSVQFENGDLDRPVIIGCVQTQDSAVLVNSQNPNHNLIRTRGGHSLLFDDTSENEKIELSTLDSKNTLTLSASSNGHRVSLTSMEGDLELNAGKTGLIKTGEGQSYQSGENFSVNAQTKFELITQEAEISIQSATTFEQTATQAIRLQSREGNVGLTSEGSMSFQASNGFSQSVDTGNYEVQVQDGGYQLTSSNGITINSEGAAISLAQGDGNIEINGSGNLVLSGSAVEITGDSISVKGNSIANN